MADVNDAEEESAGQDTPMGTLYFVNFDEEEEEQMQDGPYDTEQMMYEDFMYGDIGDYYDDMYFDDEYYEEPYFDEPYYDDQYYEDQYYDDYYHDQESYGGIDSSQIDPLSHFWSTHTVYSDWEDGWDDEEDAVVCKACGGAGCKYCGGYGHFHLNQKIEMHGHGVKHGLKTGHHHNYLPDAPSAYSSPGLRTNYKMRKTRTMQD